MAVNVFDLNSKRIQMTLAIKLYQLKREDMPSLTYDVLEDYCYKSLWKMKQPTSLANAVDQILAIPASDLVRYMAQRAIVDGAKMNLSEFADVIGG